MSYWTPMELETLSEYKDKINLMDKEDPYEVSRVCEKIISDNIQGLTEEYIYRWRFGFYYRFFPDKLGVIFWGERDREYTDFVHVGVQIILEGDKTFKIIVLSFGKNTFGMDLSQYREYFDAPIKFKDFFLKNLSQVFFLDPWEKANPNNSFKKLLEEFIKETNYISGAKL